MTPDEATKQLLQAVKEGNLAEVRDSLDAGANPNVKDERQRTAMHWAAGGGSDAYHNPRSGGIFTDIARLLIEKGADVNARDSDGRTPLRIAADSDESDLARMLVEKGADISARDAALQSTALHGAVAKGHLDLARLLLEKGADVNARDSDGQTPLHKAAGRGHLDLARLLIEKGADVNARDGDGQTPLHNAAGGGHTDVVQLLIEKGTDPGAKSTDGETPKDLAFRSWRREAYRLLNRVTPPSASHADRVEGQPKTSSGRKQG